MKYTQKSKFITFAILLQLIVTLLSIAQPGKVLIDDELRWLSRLSRVERTTAKAFASSLPKFSEALGVKAKSLIYKTLDEDVLVFNRFNEYCGIVDKYSVDELKSERTLSLDFFVRPRLFWCRN